MPEYLYRNPKNGEIVAVIQRINEEHSFSSQGVKYERVYVPVNLGIDSNIDPNNQADFISKTKAKTYGELWDASAELSSKRAEKNQGSDPVKADFKKEYSAKNKGKKIAKNQ